MKLIRTTGSGRVRYYQLDFKIKNIKGGFMPVSFAEIEAFPSAVLAHHWPDVPRYKALGNSMAVPVMR
jgi:site-specific DNA-cytosine methylase